MPSKMSSKSRKKEPVTRNDFTQKHKSPQINSVEAPKENIFDLTKLVGIQHEEQIKKESNVITPDEQNKMTMGYTEVSQSEWESIPKGAHIRYLRKDGNFRTGGYVRNVWINAYGVNKGRKCVQLASALGYKAKTWTVCFDDVDKIWKQTESENQFGQPMQQMANVDVSGIKTNAESIEYLTKSMDQMKITMTKLHNEQTRIVNLIKKLHNIQSKPRAL
jgi:hypothetical protein